MSLYWSENSCVFTFDFPACCVVTDLAWSAAGLAWSAAVAVPVPAVFFFLLLRFFAARGRGVPVSTAAAGPACAEDTAFKGVDLAGVDGALPLAAFLPLAVVALGD